jgi:very-short-patch-repair endonuclease
MKRGGLHFRRQSPIGKYYPDFACHRAKLVVELDGSQHGEAKQQAHDLARTSFLESRGYRVMRFWNGELLANLDAVVELIYATALERKALLNPPPDASRASGASMRRPPRAGGGGG